MPGTHRVRTAALAALLLAAAAACTTPSGDRIGDLPLSAEPLTGKFVWHDLVTDDAQQAKAFYGALMGWSFEDTTHPGGGEYTLIRSGDRFVGGIVELEDPEGVEYSRWLGYLSVADVDDAVQFNRTSGGKAVAGPLDLPGVGRAAAIRDPEGAVVGLLRSKLGDPLDSLRPMVGVVVWNELLAADDVAAAEFYAVLAGLDIDEKQREGGIYRVLRSQGLDRAGVMPRPAEELQPLWLTHFGISDVATATGRAEESGARVLLAPDPELRDGRFAVVVDPGGAVLALRQWDE